MEDEQFKKIKAAIQYDPITGSFVWLVNRPRVRVGDAAGHLGVKGYIHIKVCGVHFRAHRLAFLLMTCAEPDGEVDHINGDRTDNRWQNLRICCSSENSQNQRAARRDNKSSGLLGVSWSKQKRRWRAAITVNGKKIQVGVFHDAQEAHEAYVQAKRRLHPACTI